MPSALLHLCTYPGGCDKLVSGARCPEHAREVEQQRGSAHARGYTRGWREFRAWFIRRLIAFGIAPVCGARWPGQPATGDSLCQREGRLTAGSLHLDHTPPLTPAERRDPGAVCDERRVQLLCEACHNAKSARESGR